MVEHAFKVRLHSIANVPVRIEANNVNQFQLPSVSDLSLFTKKRSPTDNV